MVSKKTWQEFRATGLLCLINSFLHIFGWAIVVMLEDDGTISDCYPARVKFRGFDDKSISEAYKKVSEYMVENGVELLKEASE